MAGGYNLNPTELAQIQYIQEMMNRPGTGSFGSMIPQIISGAQQRRATNLQTRAEGMTQLQQEAMQLAAQGADQEALMNALTGQAGQLPLMGGPKGQGMLGDLAGFVGGLYGEGPVSGLAPADYRSQFNTSVLDQADQGGIGQVVIQDLQKGVPFVDIRDHINQMAIAAGYDEAQSQAAVQHAEDVYQKLTGVSLADMRSAANALRTLPQEDVPTALAGAAFGMQTNPLAVPIGNEDPYNAYKQGLSQLGNDPQGLLGRLANDPRFGEIVQNLQGYTYQTPEDQGFSLFHPSTWFGG